MDYSRQAITLAALFGLVVGGLSIVAIDHNTGMPLVWFVTWLCFSPAIAGAVFGRQPRRGAITGGAAALAPLLAALAVFVTSPMLEAQMAVQPAVAVVGVVAWAVAVTASGALSGMASATACGWLRTRLALGRRFGHTGRPG